MSEPTYNPLNEQVFDGHHDQLLADVVSLFRQANEEDVLDFAFINEHDDIILANLIESLTDSYRVDVWSAIHHERWWPILHLLQYETARHVFRLLSYSQRVLLLNAMSENDIVTFAEILPEQIVDDYLDRQELKTSEQLHNALSYQDEEVGRYINYQIIRVRPSSTVQRIQERIKNKSDHKPVAVFVIDKDGQFEGTCLLDEIYQADLGAKAEDLCEPISVLTDKLQMLDPAQSISRLLGAAWYPVQKNGQIVGAVSVSLLMLRLKDRSLESLASDSGSDEEDLFTPVAGAAKLRAIWLVTNLLTAFMASAVIGLFEHALQQVVALAILMPVVASMGGIAGSQTLAVALRGIALNHLQQSNLRLLLDKELKIAAFNGTLLGLLIATVVWHWFDSVMLGAIIFVAILLNSLAAASSATVIPFLLKKLRIDPAVAGAVVLTTVTDIVGFVVFLGLGSLLLSAAL